MMLYFGDGEQSLPTSFIFNLQNSYSKGPTQYNRKRKCNPQRWKAVWELSWLERWLEGSPRGSRAGNAGFLIGMLLTQVRWCYGKLLRLIVTPWALCCEYTKLQYEGHHRDIGWGSFIGFLALMRVTNKESLLTLDHGSRKPREMGGTVKARWGRDLSSSQRGWILRRKKLTICMKKDRGRAVCTKTEAGCRTWVICRLRENQRARAWEGSGEGRRQPTLTFPTLSLHGKLTPQGMPDSSSWCLQNDNGMVSAGNGSYGQMFKKQLLLYRSLGDLWDCFGKLKLCSILQLCWIRHFPNWAMESFHFHF